MAFKCLRRLAALGPMLIMALALCGCFDYEVELALTRPGAGSVDVRLSLPEHLTHGHHVGYLNTLVFPKPDRRMETRGGRLTISETSHFPHLDEVAARRVLFQIEEIGTGLLGMTDYRYRLTTRMEMAEGDLPDRDVQPGAELEERRPGQGPEDEDARRARELTASSLAGHHVSMSYRVPGRVQTARPLILGASQVDAVISPDGSRVTWKVPLAVLVNENVRQTLVFSADFKGNFEFRAYMQKDAKSHYPDYFDEGLAEGKDMGERKGPGAGKRGKGK